MAKPEPKRNPTIFEHDDLGRRTKRKLPGGQEETFGYDLIDTSATPNVRRNWQSHTAFNTKSTILKFDAAGRLVYKIPDATLPRGRS